MKYIVLVLSTLVIAACGHGGKKKCEACNKHGHGATAAPLPASPMQAAATINSVGKSKVSGLVQLAADGSDVRVTYNLKGLKKNASHGFHIHEFGDCTSLDGSTAGSHFNPTSAPHGAPDAPAKHVGDLGNVKADAKGTASGEARISGGALGTLVGRSLMLHAGADDLTSQPSGNSGDRIACGVIGVTR